MKGSIIIEAEFDPRQNPIVYLKTDPEQLERMVCEIKLSSAGTVFYGLGCGTEVSWHYPAEITSSKDDLKSIM